MKNLLKTFAVLFLASVTTFAGTNPTSSVDDEKNSIKFGMYFNQDSEKIRTFYEKETGEKLEVRFIDSDGKVISQTGISKKLTSAQMDIDVSQLVDGNYTIEVTSENEVLTREVVINTSKPVKELKF